MNQNGDEAPSPAAGAVKTIWVLILALAVADIVVKVAVGLTFQMRDITGVIGVVAAGLALSAFYTIKRPDERIARLFRAAVELFLLSFLTGSLSYSATSLGRPLWDEMFLGWDTAIGFDWKHWLQILDGFPWVHRMLALAYHSMWPQLTLVLIALVATRQYRRLDVMLLAFGFSAIITVIIAAFMPALSPLAYLQITPHDHPHITLAVPREFEAQALALRSGAMRVIELGKAQGLVTFPSFHTVSAVLLLLGFRDVPYMRWVAYLLNALMLIAIPIEGSHYLVDVFAGIAVALTAWAGAGMVVKISAQLRVVSPRGPAIGSALRPTPGG
jgi:hypothetical protein